MYEKFYSIKGIYETTNVLIHVTANADHLITIPTFVMRGAGKQTHYEYEVRIIVPDGKLCILRRYSRFRELHMSMKNLYGAKVCEQLRLHSVSVLLLCKHFHLFESTLYVVSIMISKHWAQLVLDERLFSALISR